MTDQRPQPAQCFTAPSLDDAGPTSEGLITAGLSTEDLDLERDELDRAWAEFSRVRAGVAEVMLDDELRAFGINVEALDERP